MTLRLRRREAANRSPEESEQLQALSSAVYTAEETSAWPGRHIEWSSPQWDVAIVDEHDAVVSYAGLVIRDAFHDGRSVRIGGIGGVKTHPGFRGRGLAGRAIDEALDMAARRGCDFALLVCEDDMVPHYGRSGWVLFPGTMLTTQGGSSTPFVFNRVMLRPLGSDPPTDGTIDLCGPPW